MIKYQLKINLHDDDGMHTVSDERAHAYQANYTGDTPKQFVRKLVKIEELGDIEFEIILENPIEVE